MSYFRVERAGHANSFCHINAPEGNLTVIVPNEIDWIYPFLDMLMFIIRRRICLRRLPREERRTKIQSFLQEEIWLLV